MIGRMLGNRYEVTELIGEGGMASVYKARCHLLNRDVAIKMLRPEFASDEEFLLKFEREAQSSASLSHPNIVNVYDVGTEQSFPYIVMELVKGKTLKGYIQSRSGFLSTLEIAQIARQVAMALDHAHSHQIIHRDIKPQNILITDDGLIKVADFGIARVTTSSTIVKTNEAMGSVHYAAPEQARGSLVDARSDLYSLGILMFELATGRVPFDGDTAVTVALKHLKEEVVPPSMVNGHISQSLEAIILKLIQKEPSQRYQSAARLVEDLDKVIANPEEEIEVYLNDLDSTTMKLPNMESYEANYKKQKKRSSGSGKPPKKRGMAMAVVGAFILALLIVIPLIAWIVSGGWGPKSHPLPDLAGMTKADAELTLNKINLKAEFKDSLVSSDVPSGSVVSTDQPAGTQVKEGQTIVVTLSTGGGGAISVPTLIGHMQTDAESILSASGLKLGKTDPAVSDQPEGTIISQDPVSGSKIRSKDTVNIVVSTGSGKAKVTMPNLLGKSIDDAKAMLVQLQMTKDPHITYKSDSNVDPDIVISQSVNQGEQTTVDTVIELVVNKIGGSTPTTGNGDASKMITKLFFVPVGVGKDQTTVKVSIVQNGQERVVYTGKHNVNETTIKVNALGLPGPATMKVYYDNELQFTDPITFN